MTIDQPWWLTRPVAEVAAAILPLFPYPTCAEEAAMIRDILAWGQPGREFPGLKRFDDPDARAMLEAIQVLDHAGLLMRTVVNRQGAAWTQIGLTRLGMYALQTNTVRQHSNSPTPHHRFQTDPLPGFVVGLRYLGESPETARPPTGDTKTAPRLLIPLIAGT
jgi:hypothetical protein